MPNIDKINVNGTTYDITDTTSGYMSTISSPTADDVLTVDANGQATDSGVQISDLATTSDVSGKVSKSGDTMTETLFVNSSNIDLSSTPSSNKWGSGLYLRDNNGTNITQLRPIHYSTGTLSTYLNTQRTISDTTYSNGLGLAIRGDGTPNVALYGTDVDIAWRTAIGAQASLTAGNGISIDSSNNISVAFANLVNENIDDVNQFVGYAQATCQNLPVNMGGLLISRVSTNNSKYGVQLFYPANSTVSYVRRKNNSSTWSAWGRVNDSYKSGDTFTIGNSTDYNMLSGYCLHTSTADTLRFFIPFEKPITATTVNISKMNIYVQTVTKIISNPSSIAWVIGSTSGPVDIATATGYSITPRIEPNGLFISVTVPVTFVNRDIAMVLLGNTTISFT